MAKEKKEARRPRAGEERFAAYLEAIVAVLGHASRAAAAVNGGGILERLAE